MKRLMRMVFLGLVLLLATAPAGADMVARYTFDDGTAVDSSGNGNNGTIFGGVTAVTDAGQCLKFQRCKWKLYSGCAQPLS
ncbi:MAG TPA: hypothetical protein PKB02_16200 [Anaerohalosphaeraceae bacterium]|nr:hypothetical protein [Anaerohalosphaeraceae bacterium]